MSTAFTIGCDPEIFLRKNNKGHSVAGLIPGSKESPHKTDGGAVQQDGFAAEFNTDPVPLNNFDAFNVNIVKQLRQIREIIPKEYSLSIVPTMDYDKEHYDEQDPATKELGCDPDYNAYTLEKNPRPLADGEEVLFRSGAGHIHIGWGADIPVDNEEHLQICANFVKMLDASVGMFMTVIDRDARRRELYGKAGAFRPKPYGVEYRTPSNLWIVNRDRRSVVHGLVEIAVHYAKNGYDVERFTGYRDTDIQRYINEGDAKMAQHIVERMLRFNRNLGTFEKIVKDMETRTNG